ncbi:MAG TPA: magnesium transporter, partial [Beijerinckiaceae bacterium]|nr:magnesium transporter [Beijerinckiaceae bacterium]
MPGGASGAVPPLREEDDGHINPDFVAAVAEAVGRADGERVRVLTADLHEADVGDLLEALEPHDRPPFIELLGRDFDFTALTEVDDAIREDLLEELKPETVAEGVRDLDSDDAVSILEDLDEADRAEILERLPAAERDALRRSLDYPEDSAGRRMQA